MPDKRDFNRINIICGVDITPAGNQHEIIKGVIVNICGTGIGIVSIYTDAISVDASVYLNFTLPSGPDFKNTEGMASRVEAVGERHYTYIGINLKGLSPKQRNILNSYVTEMYHKQYFMKLGL